MGPCPQPTFIVKVHTGLCPLLLDDFPAVHHVCPPAGLLLLLTPLQGLNEVVSAVRTDEARLNQGRSEREEKGREKRHEYMAQYTQALGNALGRVHMGVIRIFFQGLGEFWDPVLGGGVRRLCKGALPISSKAGPLVVHSRGFI